MVKQHEFVIDNLHAGVAGKQILNGVNLTVRSGETHALMGPNGSGKSTLANVIMGHPKYEVTEGRVLLNGVNVLDLEPDQRAVLGLFLAFQYPVEISGVTITKFLKRALEAQFAASDNGKRFRATEFIKDMKENVRFLELDESFVNRYLNEGFSGGEKKRMEVLQMLMLKPKFAILDETDSGLDIDAIKVVAKGVNKLKGPETGTIVITHYQRILNYVKPDFVHILYNGRVVTSAGSELVDILEEKGYDWVKEEYGEAELMV